MEEINLKELFNYYLKKLPIIIIVIVIFVVMGMVYVNKIQVPMYHGTTTIILVQKNDDKNNSNAYQNELNINQRLVSTYSQIIKSRRVLDQVKSNLELEKLSVNDLANKIGVTGVDDTSIIKVSVSDKNNKMAMNIANEVASVFKKEITDIYNLENVSVVDKAIIEEEPYNVNIKKELLIFGFAGLVLSCGVIFVIYYFDNTIKSKKDIESLDLPILAEVPSVKRLTRKGNNSSVSVSNNLLTGISKKNKNRGDK